MARGRPEEECSTEEGKGKALKLEGWWAGGSAAAGKAVPLKEWLLLMLGEPSRSRFKVSCDYCSKRKRLQGSSARLLRCMGASVGRLDTAELPGS